MANEIGVTIRLTAKNGNYEDSLAANARFDQSSQGAVSGILTVSTSLQTLSLGSVQNIGFAAFRNLSTATSGTAYVAIGAYDGTAAHELVALRRGQPCLFPVKSDAVLTAQAYGQPSSVQYIVLSE